MDIQSEEAVGPSDETVLIWSRRNASWASLFFATTATVIAVAHAFFLSRPSFAFLMLGGIFTFGALVWGKRAIVPTEAVRITVDGILDRTSPIGTERLMPASVGRVAPLESPPGGLAITPRVHHLAGLREPERGHAAVHAFVLTGSHLIRLVPDPDVTSTARNTRVELLPGWPVESIRVSRIGLEVFE